MRVGPRRARWLYVGSLAGAALGVVGIALTRPWALLALGALVLAVRPARAVLGGAEGAGLLAVLGRTGQVQLALGALLALGILL